MRSLCSTVCKWTYRGQDGLDGQGWGASYFESIGLGELVGSRKNTIGARLAPPGARVGQLTPRAAAELGLPETVSVAASMIDAHAGALWSLGVDLEQGGLPRRMAVIAGTSTCHITVSEQPQFVPGVWGPYFSVVLSGMWTNEAGQSAAGALIDRIVQGHGAYGQAKELAGGGVFALLDERLAALAADGDITTLTAGLHVQPDFHGNRSPIADPTRKGALVGLGMESDIDDLARLYLATIQALAYGTRHIIEEMKANGVDIGTIVVSGGLAKNRLYLDAHADATGCTVLVPDQAEPVLLGSAMLGAVAAGAYPDLPQAMQAMAGSGDRISPRGRYGDFHDRKYKVFRRMQQDFVDYKALMDSSKG